MFIFSFLFVRLSNRSSVFFYLDLRVGQTLAKGVIVIVGYVQELDSPGSERLNGFNDVLGVESNVLDAGSAIVIDVLLKWIQFLGRSSRIST